jgi:hypothetical protein
MTGYAEVMPVNPGGRLVPADHPGVIAQWLESFFLYRASAL